MSDLFDEEIYEPSRSGDWEGAIRLQERSLTRLQRMVLDYLRKVYPSAITDHDMEAHFRDHRSTWRARRSELVAKGLVYDTGRRKMQDGTQRILWRATTWTQPNT